MVKEEQWRKEGMDFCIRFLENNGNDVDALKKEIQRRGAYHIPCRVSKAEEEQFCKAVLANVLDTVLIMTIAVLHDEFDFGKKRIARFKKMFTRNQEWMEQGALTWTSMQENILKYLAIQTEIRWHGHPPEGTV